MIQSEEIGIIDVVGQPILVGVPERILIVIDLKLFRDYEPANKLDGLDNYSHI